MKVQLILGLPGGRNPPTISAGPADSGELHALNTESSGRQALLSALQLCFAHDPAQPAAAAGMSICMHEARCPEDCI